MKIAAIVQARTTSTRLPRKVLKELPYNSGITCLEQVIRRLKRCQKLDEIIIATTKNKEDNPIVNIAKKENINYFRGSEEDVLSRYYFTAKKYNIDIIVRVTSDCPCIDPKIVDKVITNHLKLRKVYVDYTSNNITRTYPQGLDVEVFDFDILEKVYFEVRIDYDKEHVTPYIRRHLSKFRLNNIVAPETLNFPDVRITLDTKDDYKFLCRIFKQLYPKDKYFGAKSIIKLLRGNVMWKMIKEKTEEIS